jgi:hypothetical protein
MRVRSAINELLVAAFGCPIVLVLDFQPDELGCLVQPSGVTFLLLNLDRQKKLHGTWWWIAQRFELAGTDQNGNMFRLKAQAEGGFAGV